MNLSEKIGATVSILQLLGEGKKWPQILVSQSTTDLKFDISVCIIFGLSSTEILQDTVQLCSLKD